MLEDDGVLPDKADDAWSGGLDDAGQSTARPATAGPGSAATGRSATEPGADADTCLERDQTRSKLARAQLPEPGRCHQDATRGRGPDLANNTVYATTATAAAAGPAVAFSLTSCWMRLRTSVRQSEPGILDPPSASAGFSGRYGCRTTSHPSRPAMLEEKGLPDLLWPERCLLSRCP